MNENAVGWRRGPKPQGGISFDSQLEIEQQDDNVVEQEDQPMPWMRGKKVAKGIASHVEDTTVLQLDEREEIQQQQIDEVPVMWQRGVKHRETLQHQEDIITQAIDKVEEQELQEIPVAWPRGKKVSKGIATHVEDTTVIQLDEHQQVDQELSETETPVMWRRGPKPQPTEDAVQIRAPSKPWTEEQVKLKPPRQKSVEKTDQIRADSVPKQPTEKVRPWTEEQVTLKTARRESIEIEKPKPAKDEVQLKPVKTTKPQLEEAVSEKPKVAFMQLIRPALYSFFFKIFKNIMPIDGNFFISATRTRIGATTIAGPSG